MSRLYDDTFFLYIINIYKKVSFEEKAKNIWSYNYKVAIFYSSSLAPNNIPGKLVPWNKLYLPKGCGRTPGGVPPKPPPIPKPKPKPPRPPVDSASQTSNPKPVVYPGLLYYLLYSNMTRT